MPKKQIDNNSENIPITREMIIDAFFKRGPWDMLEWLREEPRTWRDVLRKRSYWAVWLLINNVEGIPGDLVATIPENQLSWALSKRPDVRLSRDLLDRIEPDSLENILVNRDDVPLDLLETLPSHIIANVMIRRPDCPLDLLPRLDSHDRARVMVKRKDCPVNLRGLGKHDIDWVRRNRPDYKPSTKSKKQGREEQNDE